MLTKQFDQAKKLELAALKGQCLNFFFTSGLHQIENLPVSLSLSMKRDKQMVQVKINKQKVGWPLPPFTVKVPFKAKLGSPMRKPMKAQRHNVVALHANQ
jgi:hypothetical protein